LQVASLQYMHRIYSLHSITTKLVVGFQDIPETYTVSDAQCVDPFHVTLTSSCYEHSVGPVQQ